MIWNKVYNNLPHDLSGSLAKNRFGYEVLFGIDQLIENYNKFDDYIIVFDYVCDIELHYENKFKFFQIKTSNTGKYNRVSFLTNRKNDNVDSIIGRMYKISGKTENEKNMISVILVSNTPLTDGNFSTKPNIPVLLDEIDNNIRNKIINALKEETKTEEVSLENIYYLYTDVGLDYYENYILGKLTNFYEAEVNCSINKPKVLLNSIKELASVKANYEKDCGTDQDEFYKRKGITKLEFRKLIDYHHRENSDLVKKCEDTINQLTLDDISFQLNCIRSLKDIISCKDKKVEKNISVIYDTIKEDIKVGAMNGSMKDYAIHFLDDHQNISLSIYDDKSLIFTIVIYCLEKIKEELNNEKTNN